MKIESLTLSNYKQFVEEKTFCFTDKDNGEVNDITLLVGNNGTGKSSVLQAIALLVGGAARPFFSPADLDFPGFQYTQIRTGRLPPRIEAIASFLPEEIEATREYAKRLQEMHPEKQIHIPASDHEISLRLDYSANKVLSDHPDRCFQAWGYQYALQLRNFTPNANALLDRVGTIHWYTEQRNLTSTLHMENIDRPSATMKNILVAWARFHQDIQSGRKQLREGQTNKYARLADLYKGLFPGHSLRGPAPKDSPDGYEVEDFFLFDGKNEYELGSMSGGERAIFPMLVDFANWNINNSIILIDEVELHLHPPLQYALLRALPKLGRNNQFIITTHSDYVASVLDNNQIIRLDP